MSTAFLALVRRPHWIVGCIGILILATIVGTRNPVPVGEQIDDILESDQVKSAFWGVYVQDLDSGRILYQRNEDKTLVPASNQKIITTAVALDALGGDYRYETTLHLNGTIEDGALKGDLILEGSGDPTFGSQELGKDNPLRTWAEQLADRGITRIEGRIIGDDNTFDDKSYSEGWDVAHITTESFAPARSGLSYRDNIIEVKIEASHPGAPPIVTTFPSGYFDIQNNARTIGRQRGSYPWIDRKVGAEIIQVRGSVPSTYRGTVRLPVSDPTAFTLHVFRQYLVAAGIDVIATVHDIDDVQNKPTYGQAEQLFVHISPPLSEIVKVINKESNNFYAEQLFHTFSWGGTSDGGERRTKQMFNRSGIATHGLSIRDGSGLSRKDMITPEAMGLLLARMHDHKEQEAFKASLARGGERRTTLQYRLRGHAVQAKTGSLEYVRALSGYALTPDGRTLAFVVMANNYTVPSYRINRAIDKIVQTLTSTQVG